MARTSPANAKCAAVAMASITMGAFAVEGAPEITASGHDISAKLILSK